MIRILILISLMWVGCKGESRPTDASASVPSAKTTKPDSLPGLLQISKEPAVRGNDAGNMCKIRFEETTPLFPVEGDNQKRFFDCKDGIFVVVVSAGNTRSTFMLKVKGNQFILLTGTQSPECLSAPDNFHMNPSADGFHYDAGRYVTYDFALVKTDSGYRGELSWPVGKQLGMMVRYLNKKD